MTQTPTSDLPAATTALFRPLDLPNGVRLENRLCKAAMEENLAAPGQLPGQRLRTLYKAWAQGGAGLLLTGNVMIAPNALTGPGGVVLQAGTPLEPFKRWAHAGLSGGGEFWMQINHPGRQVYAAMGEEALAPSDSRVDVGEYSKLFAPARALTVAEIDDLVERFATTAELAEKAGFTGVQVHAAHGYLLSQFLSPLVNRRGDEYGGSLENRARFLLRVLKAIRQRVAPHFSLSVKLNSADFQKGGFSLDDASTVVGWLNNCGVDLLELSGGSYESPAMQGTNLDQAAKPGADDQQKAQSTKAQSTRAREAYFVDFARQIVPAATMPVMVTGGITSLDIAQAALEQDAAGTGLSVLGLARAMAYVPDLPNRWQAGQALRVDIPQVGWKNRTIAALATMALAKLQLHRVSRGKRPNRRASPVFALLRDRVRTKRLTKRYRQWRENAA